MTLFEPTLRVGRLTVLKEGAPVYDESFHSGVNIIRGENSSGKSTILNLLFYALGGDLAKWSEHALLCDRVLVETYLNGKPATLSREISREPGRGMEIFGGPYVDAISAPREQWTRYPYRRSQNQESFSQVLFRLLRMPEVANDISGNLTMHQLLRILYSDQLSQIDNLFRTERVDNPQLRDTVGRLLCGAFENELYQNELRIRDLSKEHDAVSAELRSLFGVLGASHNLTPSWLDAQRRTLSQEIRATQAEIEKTERALYAGEAEDQLTLDAQNKAFTRVQDLQASIGDMRSGRESLQLEIADSSAFIASLESKLEALQDASIVTGEISSVEFLHCPACYAPVDQAVYVHACALCKSPFDREQAGSRIVHVINDIAIQLRQSRNLQQSRQEDLRLALRKEDDLQRQWEEASRQYQSLRRLPSTPLRNTLRELQRRAGYLERQVEDLDEKGRIIQQIEQLSNRKAEILAELSRLRDRNVALMRAQEERLSRAYTLIADETRKLLRSDLPRQDTFINAETINFDFGADRVQVNNQKYFSASSLAFLKNSFIAAFLFAATKEPFFRHPRFCMIDTVEEHGMEQERSHNFQRLLVTESEESAVEHQIIVATAMIAPELDTAEYTVGRASTHSRPTLRFASAQ